MKSIILPATASNFICHIFIPDSSSAVGAGKTGLLFSDVTGYYMRSGASTAVAMTMVTIATLGTYAPDTDVKTGFKLVDDTNMPGIYEIQLCNNALKTGASSVIVMIKGTGIAPTVFEINMGAASASIPDGVLNRDMASASTTGAASRSLLNAIRFLRNKWSISGTTLTVTKENDTDAAWSSVLTGDAGATTVIGSDPVES